MRIGARMKLLAVVLLIACAEPAATEPDPTDPEVATIRLSVPGLDLVPGEEFEVGVTLRADDGSAIEAEVAWTTSDAAAVTVSDAGVVRAVAPGTAIVTARAGDAAATLTVAVGEGGIAGPSGGTIAYAGAALLTVPPGAVDALVPIRVATPQSAPADPAYVTGSAVTLSFDGAFALPARLTLAYAPDARPAGVAESRLAVASLVDAHWTPLATSVVDEGANTVSADVTTRGSFGVVMAPSEEPCVGDAYRRLDFVVGFFEWSEPGSASGVAKIVADDTGCSIREERVAGGDTVRALFLYEPASDLWHYTSVGGGETTRLSGGPEDGAMVLYAIDGGTRVVLDAIDDTTHRRREEVLSGGGWVAQSTRLYVRGTGPTPEQKIDAPLRAAMRADARVPVLVLGSRQLLWGPDALPSFIAAHASADRLALREEVVAELRTIAQDARDAIEAAALPASVRVVPLWLVNGWMAELTSHEIERLAERRDVARLYLLQRPIPPEPGSAARTSPTEEPFDTTGKQIPWNVRAIGAPVLWADGYTGEGIVTALIDSPIRRDHPDLNGHIEPVFDFAAGAPYAGPVSAPHGTFVAGVIAGDGTGGIVTGIAPRTTLMPLLASGFAEVTLALQYALDNGADIVNMSFSLPDQFQLRGAWRMAAEHATAAGLVLVSGAGNFQQSAPHPVQLRTPEDIPAVIAAGGVTQSLGLTGFSSTGPVEWGTITLYGDHALPGGLIKPDVVAFPGPGYPVLDPSGGYIDPNTSIAGNSFSGPHVAGAAALLLSMRPDAPAWRVAEVLRLSARDLSPLGADNLTGAGLVDLEAAAALILE